MPQRGERSLGDHNHFEHSALFRFSEKKEKLQLCCGKNNPESPLNIFVLFLKGTVVKRNWSPVALMRDPGDDTAAPPPPSCALSPSAGIVQQHGSATGRLLCQSVQQPCISVCRHQRQHVRHRHHQRCHAHRREPHQCELSPPRSRFISPGQ